MNPGPLQTKVADRITTGGSQTGSLHGHGPAPCTQLLALFYTTAVMAKSLQCLLCGHEHYLSGQGKACLYV